jgi:MFS family permease
MSLLLSPAVIVAALGYFVDIYDLILFSIVRVPSLKSFGLEGSALMDWGLFLLNVQMVGMLVGGVLFGVYGDKKGRLQILFASILLYSTANLLNGFVTSLEAYAWLRFFAGLGLAGELGAGITLVSESLPKEKRGYGTTLVAGIGVSGALAAYFVAEHFDWRAAYKIGGGLGLALLFLRIGVHESGLFAKTAQAHAERGNFLSLFTNRDRLRRFLLCILVGLQLWYVVGILVTLSPEFARALGVTGEISAGRSVFYCYGGLVVGDFGSGLLSQVLRSRRKAMGLFMGASLVFSAAYFFAHGVSESAFYGLCFLLGCASGYWAIFATVAAEQFGTNLRATVATSVPNFVRASLVPISLAFTALKDPLGILGSGALVGAVCASISFVALKFIPETYSKDLDYLET